MILDYKDINDLDRYKIMSGSIVSKTNCLDCYRWWWVLNVAPFSYFIPISTNPALVIVAIGKKDDGTLKDTLANILKTKKATICFPNKDNVELVQNVQLNFQKRLVK